MYKRQAMVGYPGTDEFQHQFMGLVTPKLPNGAANPAYDLSLIHISEPTRLLSISYAVFCLKKKSQLLNQ